MSKRWTYRELAKVRLIAQGATNIKLERSNKAIENKIRELGLKPNRKYELWTPEEIELVKQNKPVKGRSQSTINRKRLDLGIYKMSPRKKWPDQDVEKLKQLCSQGHTALSIYRQNLLEGYSRTSIQKKMCRLGLAKKNTPYKKFSQHIKLKFERFLKANWENRTPEELAEMWNADNYQHQISHRRVISYLTKLNIKISCYEVAKIKRLRAKEQKLMDQSTDGIRDLDSKIKTERIKLMRQRFLEDKDIWSGK